MFRVGQKVVCVDYKDYFNEPDLLTVGKIYEVKSLHLDTADLYLEHDKGNCGYFHTWWFSPIKELRKQKVKRILCLE